MAGVELGSRKLKGTEAVEGVEVSEQLVRNRRKVLAGGCLSPGKSNGTFPLSSGIGLSIPWQGLGCSCSSRGPWRLAERHRPLVPVVQREVLCQSGSLEGSRGQRGCWQAGSSPLPSGWAMLELPGLWRLFLAARSSRGASSPGPQVPPSGSWSRV